MDDTDADFFVFDNGKTAAFTSMTSGRYKIIVTSPDGNSTRLVVVVGDGPPPTPPKPPEPDELTKKLKVAYDGDSDKDKAEAAKDLAEMYKQISVLANDKSLTTAGDLLRKAKDTANVLVGPDQLKAAREVVKVELQKVFPADGPLTDSQRKAAAELFSKLAVIFDGLAK